MLLLQTPVLGWRPPSIFGWALASLGASCPTIISPHPLTSGAHDLYLSREVCEWTLGMGLFSLQTVFMDVGGFEVGHPEQEG